MEGKTKQGRECVAYLRKMPCILERTFQGNFIANILIKAILRVSTIFQVFTPSLCFYGLPKRAWPSGSVFLLLRCPEILNLDHFTELWVRICHVDGVEFIFRTTTKPAVYEKINNSTDQ